MLDVTSGVSQVAAAPCASNRCALVYPAEGYTLVDAEPQA
jgi:hypothetical protein